jgi:hypothetical protein
VSGRSAGVEIVETVVRYECPKCGNNCQCGVPYVPKTARAREAIEANPEKSNRAIAAEIGADEKTVRKARKSTADQSAVQERVGLDGKTRKVPKKKPEEEEDDVFELLRERNKLEERVGQLTEALNAKEARASRNWPADMTAKQIKKRDQYLGNIAWWQRELEKLYGEVTGQPPWRVELIKKDGARFNNGARLATRGEAEAYGQAAAREGEGKIEFEVLPCEGEKANMEFVGTSIRFSHGDCVLLNWHLIEPKQLPPPGNGVDTNASAEAMKAKFGQAADSAEPIVPDDGLDLRGTFMDRRNEASP